MSDERSSVDQFPAPAINARAINDDGAVEDTQNTQSRVRRLSQPLPGALPDCASQLSNAARGLLMRLLERDPRVRMRNLRQLQQSAFYMNFNFEHVKAKKVKPRRILQDYFPEAPESITDLRKASRGVFATFDQPSLV